MILIIMNKFSKPDRDPHTHSRPDLTPLDRQMYDLGIARQRADFNRRMQAVDDFKARVIRAMDIQWAGQEAHALRLAFYDEAGRHADPVPILVQQGLVGLDGGFSYVTTRFVSEYDEQSGTATGDVAYVYIPVPNSFVLDAETTNGAELFEAMQYRTDLFVAYYARNERDRISPIFHHISPAGIDSTIPRIRHTVNDFWDIDMRAQFMAFMVAASSSNVYPTHQKPGDVIAAIEDIVTTMHILPHKLDYGDRSYEPEIK